MLFSSRYQYILVVFLSADYSLLMTVFYQQYGFKVTILKFEVPKTSS